MIVTTEQLKDTTAKRRRKIVTSVVIASLMVHLIAGMGAAVWVVVRWIAPAEATFVSRKLPAIPPQIIDPKLAAAEFEAAAAKPQLDQKIASLRETSFALPDVPMAEVEAIAEFDPTTLASEGIQGFGNGIGGSGQGHGGGQGGQGSALTFFGMQAVSQHVVFALDISMSMVSKNNFERFDLLEKEVAKAISGLQPTTQFNIVVFAQESAAFKSKSVPATPENVTRALKWLSEQSPAGVIRQNAATPGFRMQSYEGGKHYGTRMDLAIYDGLELRPDLLILVSDGAPAGSRSKRRIALKDLTVEPNKESIFEMVKRMQAQAGKPAVISTIGYKNQGQDFLMPLAKENNGQYRNVQ